MKKCFERFTTDTKYTIAMGVLAFFILSGIASIYLIVSIYTKLDMGDFAYQSVNIQGYGEVVAVPDIASFTFTVREVADDVSLAQGFVTERHNEIVNLLKENNIEERDIKTTSYNIYPKYEYQEIFCITTPCRSGESVLVGQEVVQTTQVKVRDTENAGNIIGLLGEMEVSNLSSLNFTIDDQDSLKEKARELAIIDAKEKARKLEKQLGVDLDDIVGFYEEENTYGPYPMFSESVRSLSLDSVTPEISAGEDTVSVRVNLTFKLD